MVITRGGVGQDELRRANVSAVLGRVHITGPVSRARLTAELGLNRSTIGDITAQLVSLGLVREDTPVGLPATSGRRSGRPSLVVSPREDVAVIAVMLDVDRIVVALVGLGGVVLRRSVRSHPRGDHEVRTVVATVVEQVAEVVGAGPVTRCLGVGVSVPGMVRLSDGLVRLAPNLGWVDEPFTTLLAEVLDLPIVADNDANLGVMAEHLRGSAVGASEVVYISGSVGIGGGVLASGRLVRGADGHAGEVGHLLVDSAGESCRCGLVGCWETKAGENQLLSAARRVPGGGPDAVDEVIRAARAGESAAVRAVEDIAHWTGVGLRSVVSAYDPDVIVLGGALCRVWQERGALVVGALTGHGGTAAGAVDIRAAGLGDDSALLGAAELAFAPLLADPLTPAASAPG